MINENETFKSSLLNEFYEGRDFHFTKPVLKEIQKFTDENIKMAVPVKYNQYINILQYICWRASSIPNYFELFDFLVQKGININFCNEDGKTVMDYALSHKDLNLINIILQNDKFIKTPQILTNYINNHSLYNSSAILMLYEAGGDIVPVLPNIIADIRYMPKNICDMYIDIFFSKLGIQPNDNPLMNSILLELAFSNKQLLLDLLNKYETLNVKATCSSSGYSLLHTLCHRFNKSDVNTCIEIIKILINRGLDINVLDLNGMSAFRFACTSYTLVNFLITAGMKPMITSTILNSICLLETLNNIEKIIKMLDMNEINDKNLLHPFILKCRYNSKKEQIEDKKKIALLVKLGADPRKRDNSGHDANYYMSRAFNEKLF